MGIKVLVTKFWGAEFWGAKLWSTLASAAIALSASAIAVQAQTSCPTAETAKRGLVLSSTSGLKHEITPVDGAHVRIAAIDPRHPEAYPRETLTFRGLLGLEVTGPAGKSRLEYTAPIAGVFPLEAGKQYELAYTAHAEGKPSLKARMGVAVVEPLQHKIGACTYNALLIGRVSEFESGQRTPLRYDVYVPELQAVVKSTLFDEATNTVVERESFEFETIAAR